MEENNENLRKITIAFEDLVIEDLTIKMILDNEFVKSRLEINPFLKPKIASATPFRRELIFGKDYLYCTCGKSKKQPFCDGSHQGTEFLPLLYKHEKRVKWSLLCGCKNNKITAGPFCDGSHIDLQW